MTLKINLSCPRHPRYNPAIHGESGIRGGCAICYRLFALYGHVEALEAAIAAGKGKP